MDGHFKIIAGRGDGASAWRNSYFRKFAQASIQAKCSLHKALLMLAVLAWTWIHCRSIANCSGWLGQRQLCDHLQPCRSANPGDPIDTLTPIPSPTGRGDQPIRYIHNEEKGVPDIYYTAK